MKRIRDRVAGLDVHRDTVVACCRVVDPDGSVNVAKQSFATTRRGLSELAGFLSEEGVETVAHGTMLLQLGCELAQGYGIARPMPASEFPGWAQAWRPASAWSKLPAVNRDDLPLLFAGVEHRAWIVAIEAFLRGERNSLPLIHHQCRFGEWLESDGKLRHGGRPAFLAIGPTHRQMHGLAAEICQLQMSGHSADAAVGLAELHGLRDGLLAQLQALVRENQRQV